jgi:hypothetical protein
VTQDGPEAQKKTSEKWGVAFGITFYVVMGWAVLVCAGILPSPSCNPKTQGASYETERAETTVYVTRTGSKYHRAGCRYLSKSMIPITLSDAKAKYSPCSVCNPP